MVVQKNILPRIILGVYIVTQVFAFALSFLDIIYGIGTWQQSMIDFCYTVRNFSFFMGIVVVILCNRVTLDDCLLVVFFAVSYLVMRLIFPENGEYFKEIQPILMYAIGAYVAVRAVFFEWDELRNILLWAARIISVISIVVLFTNTSYMANHSVYMNFANAVSVWVALLLYSGITRGNVMDAGVSILGLILLLVYGSRGSVLTLMILAIYLLWLKMENKKRVLIWGLIAIIALLFAPTILRSMMSTLTDIGVDSRSLGKILSGSFLVSNDRLRIYTYLMSVIVNNFAIGAGLCGDRYYLPLEFSGVDATYAHNLFIEMYVDYGVFIGTFIIGIMLYLIVKCFFQEADEEKKAFFAVFFILGFMQLMISRSWLTEQNFFVFFALLVSYSDTPRKRLVWGE